jgi:hypothetical protein
MGNRHLHPDNPSLEALLDERDHLRIQISLIAEADNVNEDNITELLKQLDDLERRIAATQRTRVYS